MAITIQAENVDDAARKLGIAGRRHGINITWRRGDRYWAHEPQHETGCIVDATDIQGEEVKRSFKSSRDALRYIAGLLKRHDEYAAKQKKEREVQERTFAKTKAKEKSSA